MSDRRPPALFCKRGDLVEFITEAVANPRHDEPPLTIPKGARYRVVDLIEFGWDLRRETGTGPHEVRIMNSQMPLYVVVVTDMD
jgi:hypothetical protein